MQHVTTSTWPASNGIALQDTNCGGILRRAEAERARSASADALRECVAAAIARPKAPQTRFDRDEIRIPVSGERQKFRRVGIMLAGELDDALMRPAGGLRALPAGAPRLTPVDAPSARA